MNKYRKNKDYFLNYFISNVIVFSILNVILIIFRENILNFSFHYSLLLLIPVGILLGLIVATAFHNCSHGNIKPRVLNTVIGEICGVIALDGMRNFRVGHMLHHIHSDDPVLDPHPPHGLTFFEFIKTSKEKTINVLIAEYYRNHGSNKDSKKNIQNQLIFYKIGFVLKLSFWFLLLGPLGFILFYTPTFLSYFFGFAHLNYISHSLDEHNEEVMHNHDGGILFSFLNIMTSGGYYHKNHHKHPGLYNPKKLENLKSYRHHVYSN